MGSNPGLDFLWAEERARREALLTTGAISEEASAIPSVDTLLPLSGRPDAIPTESELSQVEKFRQLVKGKVKDTTD